MSRGAQVIGWSDSLVLTITTTGGEEVVLDIPSLLHDQGLLWELMSFNGIVPLRVNHVTGKYIGVEADTEGGYRAVSGPSRVTSTSARDAAYKRAMAYKNSRTMHTEGRKGKVTAVKRRRLVDDDDDDDPVIDHWMNGKLVHTTYAEDHALYGRVDHWENYKKARYTFAEGHARCGEIEHIENGKIVRTTFAEGHARHLSLRQSCDILDRLLGNDDNDDKEGEECVFVKERTREQRDAEGRANAVVVDDE